jgi:hypothetical protein
MANFPTHIAVGTVVSGALATVTLAADVVTPDNLVAVTLAGVLGSVLPDIDLKDSRPSRAMFAGLGVFFSFAVLFSLERRYSIAEMLVLWLGTLVLIRYVVQGFFHRLSVHRGTWHSLLAGFFCACLTALVYTKLLARDDGVAWLAAGFLFIGYLTHLILDEIYSVDVMDTRIKSSFGTALKLADLRYPRAAVAMGVAAVIAFVISPPMSSFVQGISSRTLWGGLHHRLLPQDKWFGVDWRTMARTPAMPFRTEAKTAPSTASPIETGSITPPAKSK